LTPGRYASAEAAEEDGEPFEDKMERLTLEGQSAEGERLEAASRRSLHELGSGPINALRSRSVISRRQNGPMPSRALNTAADSLYNQRSV
jgi:hypothetical protein